MQDPMVADRVGRQHLGGCRPPAHTGMIDLPMADLRGRVLVSRERVKFTDADPYAHLASGADVNMIMSHRVLRDGLVVGVIAYASVALFYSAFDFLAARGALYTVDLLGRALFKGLRDPSVLMFPLERDLTAILLYNAFHLLMSLTIGLVVVSLVEHAERHPSQALLVLVMIVAGGVLTVFGVTYLTESIRPLLPWWSIVVANALAALFAGFYLVRQRPGLGGRLNPRILIDR
jgi:hypothetical protein